MEAMEGVMKDQKPMREGGTWLLVQRRLKGMCSTKGGELGVQGEVHKEVKSNRGGPKFVVMFGNEVEATHKGDSERWSVLGIDMINSMRFRGSRIFILTAKLKAFKMDLKSWNQEVFGSVLVKKLEAFNKIGFRMPRRGKVL
ncbi:hypothetical protein CK203_056821 [Vitis vinifera]|uniref:Uncharacterized protein n=1 Tax=Vitis vinifera TaxID=29760 RepID=A0A438GQ89_VITVI|nr:hypothetical protein CK203_056821 [Vitis vinifera]